MINLSSATLSTDLTPPPPPQGISQKIPKELIHIIMDSLDLHKAALSTLTCKDWNVKGSQYPTLRRLNNARGFAQTLYFRKLGTVLSGKKMENSPEHFLSANKVRLDFISDHQMGLCVDGKLRMANKKPENGKRKIKTFTKRGKLLAKFENLHFCESSKGNLLVIDIDTRKIKAEIGFNRIFPDQKTSIVACFPLNSSEALLALKNAFTLRVNFKTGQLIEKIFALFYSSDKTIKHIEVVRSNDHLLASISTDLTMSATYHIPTGKRKSYYDPGENPNTKPPINIFSSGSQFYSYDNEERMLSAYTFDENCNKVINWWKRNISSNELIVNSKWIVHAFCLAPDYRGNLDSPFYVYDAGTGKLHGDYFYARISYPQLCTVKLFDDILVILEPGCSNPISYLNHNAIIHFHHITTERKFRLEMKDFYPHLVQITDCHIKDEEMIISVFSSKTNNHSALYINLNDKAPKSKKHILKRLNS